MTIDEPAFGYNAVLLSETLHDENGRYLPVFVLSLDGKDWRQPVTQYFMAVYFKIFGASVYNLKFTSVIVAAVGSVLMYLLGRKLLGNLGGWLSLLFFATTPIVMMHSHLGLDNIMPIPFVIVWLLGLFFYEKTTDRKYMILSAVALGIGFYTYKGMRSFVPVWTVLTGIYLLINFLKKRSKKQFKEGFRNLLYFGVAIAPFYLAIPFLEYKYANAIFGQSNLQIDSIYIFLTSYLSSFDPSFLFITGDTLPHHSTGRHGMFLLASLPFFLIGLYQAAKKSKYWKFLVIAFFAGPLLFGFPGSIHRASRLMAFIPVYALISALGATLLLKKKQFKYLFVILAVLVGINYFDFISYYWYQYPKDNYHIFYRSDKDPPYKALKERSIESGKKILVTKELLEDEGIVEKFVRSIYFVDQPDVWEGSAENFPENGILLSTSSNIKDLEATENIEDKYFLHERNEALY
jgi:4-amino-4-deoxy-L-arabinose transferase-like glycosyltransferase